MFYIIYFVLNEHIDLLNNFSTYSYNTLSYVMLFKLCIINISNLASTNIFFDHALKFLSKLIVNNAYKPFINTVFIIIKVIVPLTIETPKGKLI